MASAKIKKTAVRKIAKPVSKKKVVVKAKVKGSPKKATAKTVALKRPLKKAAAKKAVVKKSVAPKAVAKPALKKSLGLPEQLRDAALKVLDERQADDIVTVSLTGRSSIADYLIIASGRAARQIAAIGHYLQDAFEKLGSARTRVEGLPEANWVLVDCGDVIVHLFLPEVRRYYNLDQIWQKRA